MVETVTLHVCLSVCHSWSSRDVRRR